MLNIERRQKYSEQGHTISKNPNLIDIKFDIKESNYKDEFKITTNTDVYDFSVIQGKKYIYFLQNCYSFCR